MVAFDILGRNSLPGSTSAVKEKTSPKDAGSRGKGRHLRRETMSQTRYVTQCQHVDGLLLNADRSERCTSMHQILQTAGIVESIVTHAHRVSSIETATLARVSRTFTDPALNALWRHLESFLPLLKLFSGLNSVTLECTQTEEGCLASVYVCSASVHLLRNPLTIDDLC